MSTPFRRTLPARPDLEQQKKLAKDLLRAFRAGDRDANARVREALPDKDRIALADAQFTLAREYGFQSWSALRRHIEDATNAALPPIERFRRAVIHRDARALRQLLSEHAEVRAAINDPLFDFDSPAVRHVASDDSTAVLDVLLEFGADPDRKSSWWAGGFHALYSASPATASRLLAAGATVDACAAAHLDRVDLLERLVGDNPARVHERGGDGQTPLHFARSRPMIDFLLEHGADIDARDVDHRSTAAEWMVGERTSLARYLVERGASADIFLAAALGLTERARNLLDADPGLLSLRTGQGEYAEKPPGSFHTYLWSIGSNMTPLQTAAKFGQLETMNAMSTFASPVQRLLLACNRGDARAARAVVAENPGIIASLDAADQRALTDEAWAANAPAVVLMLELGFDPSAESVSGPTGGNALHCAAWEGSVACVEALLNYESGRALIDSRDSTYNGTPLGWCLHGSTNCGNPNARHADVARLLIAAGATIEPQMLDAEGPDELVAFIDEVLRPRAEG